MLIDERTAIESGDLAVWFLLKGQGFDVGQVTSPHGELRGYYIDALMPVNWRGSDAGTLEDLVDLYLDLWIWPDYRYARLDDDELDHAVLNGHIAAGVAAMARQVIDELAAKVAAHGFPPREVLKFRMAPSELERVRRLV